VVVALAVIIGPLVLLARRFDAGALALGVSLTPALVGVAAAVVAPGASYLLLWPAACAIVATWVTAHPGPPMLRDVVFVTAVLAPAVALWAPHVSLFLTGLTLTMAPALGPIAALAALSLAPVAALLRRRQSLTPITCAGARLPSPT
jgi:hypothetical protein